MGAKTESILEAISSQIANNGPHEIVPEEPTTTVPQSNITDVMLSEPPSYTLGQKVFITFWHIYEIMLIWKQGYDFIPMQIWGVWITVLRGEGGIFSVTDERAM